MNVSERFVERTSFFSLPEHIDLDFLSVFFSVVVVGRRSFLAGGGWSFVGAIQMRKFYPNPFLSRLTRELWSISSSCMLLADCPDGCSLSIAPLGDDSHMDDIIVSIAGAGAIPVSYEQSLTLLRAFEMAGKSHQRDSPGHSSVDDPYSSDILRFVLLHRFPIS